MTNLIINFAAVIFNSFPDPNASIIPPWNYRRGKEVNKYVEHYADSQKIKQDEAIQVQGSELIIWNRILSNRFCTCQHLESSINNNPSVLEDVRPEVIEAQNTLAVTSLQPSKTFPKNKAKQDFDNQLQDIGLGDLSSFVDSLYEEPIEEVTPTTQFPKTSKKQNNALEEAFLEQKKNLGIEVTDYVSCPICFGTRHTDTYQPHRGTRIVLDGSDFYPVKVSGARLNKRVAPYVFNLPADGANVTWTVTLPKYFKAISIKAYNLEVQSTSVTLSYALPNSSSFNPLTLETIKSRNGQNNNDLQIRCTYDESLVSEHLRDLEVNVSHVEIVLLYCEDFDKGELPMLTIPEQIDFQELYLRSRIVLSPRITTLSRNDLICENKYGLLWQVVDVEKLYTAGGKLMNLKAEIRLVQNSEKMYNLSMFNRKMNTWRNDL